MKLHTVQNRLKNLQHNQNRKQSTVSQLASVKKIALTTMALSLPLSMGLTGCQSTDVLNKGATLVAESSTAQSEQAKAQLQSAIKDQLMSNFSYHGSIAVSNSKRLQALANATPEQLASSDNKYNYCEDVHDKDYVAVLKQAEQAGVDYNTAIFSQTYGDQLESIKQTYLSCDAKYEAWETDYYENDSDAEYLPNYDDKHTAADAKKANLVKAYLLEPMDIEVTGTYQPLAGKLTMLPSFSYQQRNILLGANQPIYIDFKAGDIYIWSANVAGSTAKYLDDKLGAKWHNKWLKFALNDGTLPQGFGKDLLKAYVKAMETAYKDEPVEGFNYVSNQALHSTMAHLSADNLQTMDKANQVISRIHNTETVNKNGYVFSKTLYEEMTDNYPQLIVEEDQPIKADDEKYTSLVIAKALLAALNDRVENYENPSAEQVLAEVEEAEVVDIAQYYGLNSRDKIIWSLVNVQFEDEDGSLDEGVVVDALTSYDYGSISKHLFANLPDDAQQPTADNSIDLREYYHELMDYYEQGNGTAIGKMAFGMYKLRSQ